MPPRASEARQRSETTRSRSRNTPHGCGPRCGGAFGTSPVYVEDACAFAWLQLVRRPERAFPWLCKTAIREAIRLHRRAGRTVSLDAGDEWAVSDAREDPDPGLELVVALQAITAARLRARGAASRPPGRGYTGREMEHVTGDSERTLDRQLVRAQRSLARARRDQREPNVGRDSVLATCQG